jgi:hypothetical protein
MVLHLGRLLLYTQTLDLEKLVGTNTPAFCANIDQRKQLRTLREKARAFLEIIFSIVKRELSRPE